MLYVPFTGHEFFKDYAWFARACADYAQGGQAANAALHARCADGDARCAENEARSAQTYANNLAYDWDAMLHSTQHSACCFRGAARAVYSAAYCAAQCALMAMASTLADRAQVREKLLALARSRMPEEVAQAVIPKR